MPNTLSTSVVIVPGTFRLLSFCIWLKAARVFVDDAGQGAGIIAIGCQPRLDPNDDLPELSRVPWKRLGATGCGATGDVPGTGDCTVGGE